MITTAKADRTRGSGKPRPSWPVATALFFIALLIFWPATANKFVNYDDPDYVTANERVLAGLTAENIRWALTANAASNWHPLTWMSHMLDVSCCGRNPAGHHATSVLLHALNAALAFIALRKLTRAFWPSALCALLFALHPLRVESVAWVSERKDVLSGLFFFACLWAYAGYANRRGRDQRALGWYATVIVGFGLGLMAKPMLVTLPCLLLLLDYWPLGRFPRIGPASPGDLRSESISWLVFEKLPLFALAGLSSWVTYLVQRGGGAVTSALPLDARLANAVVAVPRYVGKILWPSKLAALYQHPGHWGALVVAGAAAFLIVISVAAWRRRKDRPWLLVGWCWFLGMLVPVIGIVQVGLQSIADRYTYLPAVGIEVIVVWAASELWGRLKGTSVAAVACIAAALAALTVLQTGVWKNSLVLFNHTIAVAGEGNYLAYDNRGIAWAEIGRGEEAFADYQRALAIKPDDPNANNNIGRVLADRGQAQEAITHLRLAVKGMPGMLEMRNNLANALSDAGDVGGAIEQYEFILQRDPGHLNAHNGYAVALAMKGRLPEAEKHLNEVLRREPENASALSNLGNIRVMQGRRQEAASLYERVVEIHPDDARTWFNLGNVFLELGQPEQALEKYRRSAALNPLNAGTHAVLGFTLGRLGRRDDAIAELRLALQQRPDFPQAQAWLSAVMATERPTAGAGK